MSNYVVAFRGRADRTPTAGEDEAWSAWFGALGTAVVDFGRRVGQVRTLRSDGASASDAPSMVLTGYIVIAADDLEAAAGVAKGCPGLRAGVDVEVGEAIDA